ncbi:MAG: DUF2207 domain-containing protein [Patescibacteria group bacterium]|jgi:hypothetical protein
MKKYLLSFVFALIVIFPIKALARDNVDYWYIKNFDSNITINKDSSLSIDEKITADCGDCVGKHGIFRMLPTVYSPELNKTNNLHIELISITNFQGQPYKYQTTNDYRDHTITWKIGDPNTTVSGINEYEIKYKVLNGIRSGNSDFDEFYWNLNGNFWDLQTDKFTAYIKFPDGANKGNTTTNLYSGKYGMSTNNTASMSWIDNQNLMVESPNDRILVEKEGITLSATFPKNIIVPYKPTFLDLYGVYLYLLIPLLVLMLCILFWSKFGKDPKINPTVVPEFEIPEKMSPMSLGMVEADGQLKSQFISATIINLAVKGALKIEEIPKKGIFGHVDYKMIKLEKPKDALTDDEAELLSDIFNSEDTKLLSDMKNKFYVNIPGLTSRVQDNLVAKKYLWKSSRAMQGAFISIAAVLTGLGIGFGYLGWMVIISGILSGIILFIFSFLMRRRTIEGAKFNLRVKGLRMYMETAEKYRAKFNEKENIFEKFLPYAIMFGITTLWIEKMKAIYGEKYITSYMPIWYAGSISHFDPDTFNQTISNMSSNMASTINSSPSSSGSGGGGFSGGGGGGGGGGGW